MCGKLSGSTLTYSKLPITIGNMATEPAIGTRIRRARERRRWSQQRLADELQVNRKTIDNWENGRTSPRSSIGALEEVLGVRLDGEPEPPPGISDDLRAAVMSDPELTESEREAVLLAMKRQIAIERGWEASSPAPGAAQGRRRPAS